MLLRLTQVVQYFIKSSALLAEIVKVKLLFPEVTCRCRCRCIYMCYLTTCIDQAEAEMRDCIVNVIAVIFGSPPKSNHLWYHLMQPKDLNETFMTGFMVNTNNLPTFCVCLPENLYMCVL